MDYAHKKLMQVNLSTTIQKYIVTKPKVYSIPLEALVPINVQNVLMLGSKAGFTSLASTSAGSIPTRITVGEAVV